MKKSLVQILEAPLAGFTRIGRESFEKRLEVPSTSRVIVGLKALGLLVVGPQHCLEAQNFVSVSQNGPSRFDGAVVIRHVAVSIENPDDWPVHARMRCTASSIAWMAVVPMR